MTEKIQPKDNEPIDVEAIIADIRKNNTSGEPAEETTSPDPSIHDDFQYVSRNFSGGHWPSGGITALFRKVMFRILGMKEFNRRIVSILSRIISIINGEETPESSVFLNNQRRTNDMLVQLGKRMDECDKQNIAERLSALEKQCQQPRSTEKQ